MRERGFVPLLIPLIIAAAAAIIGVTAIGNSSIPSKVGSFVAEITSSSPKVLNQTTTYTTTGAAKSSTILVKFKSGTTDNQITNVHRSFGTKVRRVINGINVQVVDVPADKHVADVVQNFKGRSEVQYAEPNFLAQSFLVPDDPYYNSQWNLQKISAAGAWDKTQGGFGPIAVVDTGIEASHPDLNGEVLVGYNFVGGNDNTNDDNGHGTHVSGIIDAVTNNGTGISSIGFRGTLLPVKVLDSSGSGNYGDVASGIIYAANHGAKIINLSLGGSSYSSTLDDAVIYAEKHGAIVVAAAGNNGNNAPVYPAADSGVLAVSASTQDDNLASFSSFGSDVFVTAPGVNITSTYNNNGYVQMSGTSMSAPHLAGLIGLALSYKNSASIIDAIKNTSDKIGPYPYDSNGWNQYFGFGRINAEKLLVLLSGAATPTPVPSPTTAPKTHTKKETVKTLSFDVDIEGNVDSIFLSQSKIVVKVTGISQDIGVPANNLVDLFIDSNTHFSVNNQDVSSVSLNVGQKINVKALWQDNKLTAENITIQGNSQTTGTQNQSIENQNNNLPQSQAPGLIQNPGKGRVKGVSINLSSIEIFLQKIFGLFN